MFGVQMSPTGPQREASNARRRDGTKRRSKTEALGLAVEFAQCQTGLSAHSFAGRIDAYALHRREIDHQGIVVDAFARQAMSATTYGHQNIVLASKAHTLDHVSCASATCHDCRMSVDHGVGNFSRGIIACFPGTEGLTAKGFAKFLQGGLGNHRKSSRMYIADVCLR